MDVVDEIVSQTLHGSLASELAVGTAEIGFMVEAPKRGAPIGVAAIGPRVRRLLPPLREEAGRAEFRTVPGGSLP